MFNLFKQIKSVVDQATELWKESNDGKGKEGWIVFFEARSFWLAVISLLFAVVPMFGIVIPIPQEVVAEGVTQLISTGLMIWAFVERVRGNKTIVWSANQANQAIKLAQKSIK